ncbi:MAG: 16S rRNA (cytosine(1402)-N(4))-methyltransferase RsmH [bacterium]|nr:16S rRNA (cytosine(1402)-N(4))-methyltransferase RsmH [bacterium]
MHIPVLIEEVITTLAPQKGETYLDVTAGFGGHAFRILEMTQKYDGCVLIDQDQEAIEQLQSLFSANEVRIVNNDFASASRELEKEGQQFDIILADIGVSSLHLDKASRGFSLRRIGPLDMRMDQTATLDANDIINYYERSKLIKVLREYGEEYRAPKIVDRIIEHRPIKSTTELANIIARAVGGKQTKVHPATKTFQAIRIEVNDELNRLETSLRLWVKLLKPGGRLAVITFHSLEDRIVKHYFKEISDAGYESQFKLLTKKPISASENELKTNPRARSAKLRAVVKIKNRKG